MNTTATLNGQELELFRVGNYGAKGTYSAADLQDLVARYKGSDEAPITVGHPERDSEPAYGWFKSLRTDGDVLFGTPGEVNPDFEKAVQQGSFKHRSVGFARDSEGKLHLRHVAFLGAVPPAIKGLRPAQFSSDPYVEFALNEGDGDDMQDEQKLKLSIGEGIAAFFAEKFGSKQQPAALDTAALTQSVTEAVTKQFAEQLAAEKTAREKVEKDFADHRKEFSAGDAKARVATVIAELKTAQAYIPAYDKVGVPELFSALAGVEQTVTFSEGDKQVTQDLVTAFSNVLKAVGKIVPAGSIVDQGAGGEQSKALPEANGALVDPASAQFSDLVTKHAADNKIPYTEAYKQLSAQGKRPAAGSAAGGAV